MSFENVLILIGGLALFLLGMNQMSSGLEAIAGNRLKIILQKITSNRFLGVLVGAVITAIIQSSSATTVMVVGFVSVGIMTLKQAVWLIMGANIGTTITGILIGLDIGWISPIFAIVGVILLVFIKRKNLNEIGKILCGFGILFIGMDFMSNAMTPLRDSESFISIMTKFSNPFLGILAGAGFTAIIQSSSASIGILQALSISGAISFKSAVFVLFGQNIGTCVTAMIASLGTNRESKRTMILHLLFNLIGTLIFSVVCLITPLISIIDNAIAGPGLKIAFMHSLFNISTTLLLLPFGGLLVRFAEKILPDKREKNYFLLENKKIEAGFGSQAIHLETIRNEIKRMYAIAKENILYSIDGLINYTSYNKNIIVKNEDIVDTINEHIRTVIVQCLVEETNIETSNAYSNYLSISTNIERLSDHAMNLNEAVIALKEKEILFNQEVIEELGTIQNITRQALDFLFENSLEDMIHLENEFDRLSEEYKNNMMQRLKMSVCKAESSLIYSKVLIDFERIGDHLLNVKEYLNEIKI